MKRILFIHQSSELYGSDKTLLQLVSGLKAKGHEPIVVLPDAGPLYMIIQERGIHVITAPVVKISRKMFSVVNLLSLPFQIFKSMSRIHRALDGKRPDLVYSNTLAVLSGLFYARLKNLKHVWHVHEIVQHPNIVRKIFTWLIHLRANAFIIYNSQAARAFWEKGKPSSRSAVVLNGVAVESPTNDRLTSDVRKGIFNIEDENALIIGLVGRINKWKGQQLLLSAFRQLVASDKNLYLVYVGSAPPGQDIYAIELKQKIQDSGLEEKVKIIPFQNNISQVWQAIDIAVVPSTEPEPFGLVAVEAMLSSRPVIAAGHGGLSEIVVHNRTGLLFEPGNMESLRDALTVLIHSDEKRRDFGQAGKGRAINTFGVDRYVNEIEKLCLNL